MGWIIGLVGAGVSAAGSVKQGKLDEQTAQHNEQLANYQADDALRRGSVEEMQYRRQLAQLIGKQRNEIGTRNVEARGSALSLLEDSAQLGEEDALTIRNDAARQAWGYRNQASEASRTGQQSKLNANTRAGSTLLTGASQAYGQWKKEQ